MIRMLETAEEIDPVEPLQRIVWPGCETDIVPTHLLVTIAQNGGLVVGAFDEDRLVGFVFGFPGIVISDDGNQWKHCSHMLGVDPEYRNRGVGFMLKRAQWQIVRHQGLDLITWTYDPLESRNAYLNIAKLGGVCDTYKREIYGVMRDGLNEGLPSDRFQVAWWINSTRVNKRLDRKPRRKLDLAHYFQADAEVLNPTQLQEDGLVRPSGETSVLSSLDEGGDGPPMVLVEIPANFQVIKQNAVDLALQWRVHTRRLFEELFSLGYLVTDFVFLPGTHPRSFYVFSYGKSTLG